MCLVLAFFRFIIVFVNILFMLIGLAGMGLGGWIINQQDTLAADLEVVNDNNQIQWIGVGFIIFGVIVFLTSLCGFCGVWKKNKCLLMMYAVILFLALAVQITIGVLFFTFDASAEIDSFARENWDSADTLDAVLAFQNFADCCGWDTNPTVTGNNCDITLPFCKDQVDDFVDSVKNPVSYALIAFGVVELLSFIGTCLLLCKTDSGEEEEWGEDDI